MKTVPLHGMYAAGRVALVDDADYDLVIAYRWTAKVTQRPRGPHGPYASTAIRRDGKQTTIMMHVLLTGYARTDHIDGNGLNNQRSNLRPVTAVQNGQNRRPVRGHSSQYKGVRWYPPLRKWVARIQYDGRLRHLGYFTDEVAAAKAYDAEARKHFGEFARPNFPDDQAA